ncbi:hypothetical protein COV93_01835 [Candidatus Woesearchaeota archaeon CG11_big_fil_rev_8_21_14_0_20_43_8]|nr:MAG: hypothetical protein COV93_01835 [Candidatus Woesearchaeota archaeon CG11_big_fil_rev_8_21_14_0_20_43_8]PIO05560.1 MAG: hypothetical protein COT47_04280 [Candidatus Woesearchaeota archaeon CG08_land_8_20_14_0_20_43_7]
MADSTKKILVVEDEKNIAQAHSIILRDYKLFFAQDGEEALSLAERHRPDLIVLDLMLPERNGYDVCFHIRQHPELKHTKIVMVTAKTLNADEEKGVFVGADHYIRKPFEPDELRESVKRLLSQ